MTNKQERFYVVSESELDQLVRMSMLFQNGGQVVEANLDWAEATCRAREVECIGGGMYQLTDWDFEMDESLPDVTFLREDEK